MPSAPRHVSQAKTACPHRARSPVNAELLVAGIQSHPVAAYVEFTSDILLNGAGAYFTTPFDDSIPRDHCDNQKSATDHPDAVDAWVLNEMSKGRVAGPFPTLAAAHPELQVSPFGSVPKGKTGKRRATHNLSKDFADIVSINGHIDRGDATLSYVTVVAVIASANKFRRLPGGSPAVGCTDIVDAFRNVRQAPDCAHLFGFKWGLDGGPIGYFVDLCLGFGGRMNPFLWDCVAAALQWVMTARFAAAGLIADIYRLLDDVLTIGLDDYHSTAAHKCVLDTLADHGLPSHPGKAQFGRQVIFLGLGLNLTEFFLELPEDKRVEMIAMLDSIACSRHQLRTATCESITGKLGFAKAAMPHNRACINSFYASMGPALREGAYWMNPSAQMKRDAATFSRALSRQPQVAFSVFEADPTNSELTCAVDAAGRDGAGGHGLDHASGRTFGFHTPWTPGWTQDDPGVSSGLQELFTIGLIVLMHAADFISITVWTDSTVATDVVAKGRSSIGPLNHIVQIILDLLSASVRPATRAIHLRGVDEYAYYARTALRQGNCIEIPFPTEEELILFVAYLVRKPLSPSVVKQRLAAVGRWFLFATGRDCRLSLITGRLLPYLGTALESMSRTYSIQKRLRFPLTTDKLDILLRCLWHLVNNLCRLDKQMWSALLLMGVFGLCRCGEITTKTQKAFSPATDHLRSDITTYGTAADGYFDFNIRCSKTDVYRRSVLLRIFGVGPTAEHCPARAVRQYLDATSERPANSPLFALSNGKYVTRNMVNDMIKRLCGLAGFDPAKYSTHSMRAGGASSLALSGVDSATIRKLGRWESDCFIRYITISDDRRRELAVAMATLPPTSDEVRKARWVALRQAL